MRAIALITRDEDRETGKVLCALIDAPKFDVLLKKARHVGYQNDAIVVEVWTLADRASRRKYVSYVRRYDAKERRLKLQTTIVANRVEKRELPDITQWTDRERANVK